MFLIFALLPSARGSDRSHALDLYGFDVVQVFASPSRLYPSRQIHTIDLLSFRGFVAAYKLGFAIVICHARKREQRRCREGVAVDIRPKDLNLSKSISFGAKLADRADNKCVLMAFAIDTHFPPEKLPHWSTPAFCFPEMPVLMPLRH